MFKLPPERRGVALCQALLACLMAASCRPANYAPPPVDPSIPPPSIPLPSSNGLSKRQLVSTSLLGGEVAPEEMLTPPTDAKITPTGLTTSQVRRGSGKATPKSGDTVLFHFTGWDKKGDRFDNSRDRGQPERRRLESLVPGWREGVEQMVVGDVVRMWIPERLAFGSVPAPGRPAGDIILEVELLGIEAKPEIPPVPKDLKSPPQEAQTTPNGIRILTLKKGQGTRRPVSSDRVLVHYTGWTTGGRMFDSSLERGQPITFGLKQVIPGWGEALGYMVTGEHARVWIPSAQAYGDNPGGGQPGGDLVFEIHLLEIQ